MAVARATLPLIGRAARRFGLFVAAPCAGGATCWGAATAGLALPGLTTGLCATGLATGLTVFFVAGLAAGFAAFLIAGLVAALRAMVGFFVVGRAGLRGVDLATATFFAAGFLATGFLAALVAVFFAVGFLTTAGFFVTGFFVAGLGAFFAAAFFAGAGLATGFFFATGFAKVFAFRASAVFALPEAAACDRAGDLPLAALVAVELRVVFAIFLHHFGRGGPVL